VVASLDPAYLGVFGDTENGTGQLRGALRKLGFSHIRETAEGAAYVTKVYERLIQEGTMNNIITTSCTAINELVEKYYTDMIPYMAPVVSPMTAHGMMLKEEFGPDTRVIYIGSCTARGREAVRERCRGTYVDAVLDFQELRSWLNEEQIDLSQCEPYHREGKNALINGLYGVSGGILSSVEADKGFGKYEQLYVDGIDSVQELFDCIRKGEINNCFIEVSSCVGGCINGPLAGGRQSDRFKARIYTNQKIIRQFPENMDKMKENILLQKEFHVSPRTVPMPTEEEIQEALRKDGKDSPEKQLNCGACGFKTCRDKAIALCQNKEQLNLCIPYMYQQARSMSEVILSVTPNLIITVDENMYIRQFNNAAEVMFNISADEAYGMSLEEIIDPEDFQAVFREKQSIMNKKVTYEQYGLVTVQNIIYIREQNLALGILRDVTSEEKIRQKHDRMRLEAMDIAQRVIDKQMMVAQEIAGLLGETTAETKVTLMKMRDSIFYDGEDNL
jgi:PAS domain S-box-containing protein